MWRRPVLVLLYLTVVVVVTWMVELGFWWDTSYTSYQIVNPLRNLTVTQIRTLLEMRGIQYAALLEKSEIIELLQKSGPVQYGELIGRMHTAEPHGPLEISGKEDFNEQIYEEKESIWLVEVVPGEGQYAGHRVLDDRAWHSLSPKLQTLHINGAIVSCQYDRRFCARQGWSHPQLLLILPSNEQSEKSSRSRTLGRIAVRKNIALPSAVHLPVNSVLTWLHDQILSRVEAVDNVRALEETWMNVTHVTEKKFAMVQQVLSKFKISANFEQQDDVNGSFLNIEGIFHRSVAPVVGVSKKVVIQRRYAQPTSLNSDIFKPFRATSGQMKTNYTPYAQKQMVSETL